MDNISQNIKDMLDEKWAQFLFSEVLPIAITIAVAYFFFKTSNRVIRRIIRGINKSKKVNMSESKSETLISILTSITRILIVFVAIMQILWLFGVARTSMFAVSGGLSVALGFAAQDIVKDFIAGTMLVLENQYEIGDFVEINGKEGEVTQVHMRTTVLRDVNGNVYIIPNGQIKIVNNQTKNFSRAIINYQVDYNQDVDKVIEAMEDEMSKVQIESLKEQPIVLGITDIKSNVVNIKITADTQSGTQWAVERELRRTLKRRLDKENVRVPYERVQLVDVEGTLKDLSQTIASNK